MAALVTNRITIHTSIHDFHEGSARPYQIEVATAKAHEYEQTGNTSLIPDFMNLIDDAGAFFPYNFALNFCIGKAAHFAKLRKFYPVFPEDEKRILNWLGDSITMQTRSCIKRVLFLLLTTTTARSLDDLAQEVWVEWISSMKEPNTRFKEDLNIGPQIIRALRCLAEYMDAHYPSSSGYLNIVKVQRASNIGTTGHTRDLVDNPPPEYVKWVEILENYKSVRVFRSSKMPNSAFRRFAAWLSKYPTNVFSDPRVFLSAYRIDPSYSDYLRSSYDKKLPLSARNEASFIIRMIDYFIEENLVIIEEGERTELGYPIVSVAEREQFIRDSESASSGRVQAKSHPMPLKWVQLVQKILTEDDWAWPKSLDSQWIRLPVDGVPIPVWNPVISNLVYGMTELPWRKIQFKSLDSGEGDNEAYDLINDRWVSNKSPAAGYWERDPKARRKRRGVLNRQGDNFVFYVNTNKISDRQTGHGEMSGYEVPWKYSPMIKLFSDLREWQEKFNPLQEPTEYKAVTKAFDGADAPSKEVAENIPARFYLFRDVQGQYNKVSPPSDNRIYTFWRLLMDELEGRLRANGEDATIILTRNAYGAPSVAQFQMHGLRVSGLTAFAEAGVPIEILSKLVAGHASILMTIYYLKYNAAHVTDVLSGARQKVEAIAAKDFGRHLRNKSIEEAIKIAVPNESYTLEAVADGLISTDQFFDTGLGVCPYNGTRCYDGIAQSGGRTAEVPGGAKNCLHCRHFITGEPWLMALVLNQQKLAAQASDLSKKTEHFQTLVEEAESERAGIVKSKGVGGIPPILTRRIAQTEQEIERDSLDLDTILNTMNRAHVIIEAIKSIQGKSDPNSSLMLVGDNQADCGEIREGTRFELIDTVLQASRIYPVLHDEKFEMERRRYIDAIMYNNGIRPLSVMNLTEEQKIRAADEASKWLMTKVGALETQLLISGAQTLAELGYSPDDLSENIQISERSYALLEAGE